MVIQTENSNYTLNWDRVGARASTATAEPDTSDNNEATTASTFSQDYLTSDEYISNLDDSGFIAGEMDVYTELNEYGELSDLNESSTAEWDRAQIARTQQRLLNFWINNFSDQEQSLRDVVNATHQIANRSTTGENNHYAALQDILANVKNLPDSIKGRTIPKRDPITGKETGELMTLEEFANEATNDSSLLERYINSPGMRAALTASARDIMTTDKFKSDLRYDREYSSTGSQVGHAVGGTVATAGILAGTIYGGGVAASFLGWGAMAGTGWAAAGAGAAIGTFLVSNPVGWAILGVGAIVAIAGVVAVGSQAAEYIGNNRNDAPSFKNDGIGGWVGWSINNMLQGLGLRSNANS